MSKMANDVARKLRVTEEDQYGGMQIMATILVALCFGALAFTVASYWMFTNSSVLREQLLSPTITPTPAITGPLLLTLPPSFGVPQPPPLIILESVKSIENRQQCPQSICTLQECTNDEQCSIHIGGGTKDLVSVRRCHQQLHRCVTITCDEYTDGRTQFSPCIIPFAPGICQLGTCHRRQHHSSETTLSLGCTTTTTTTTNSDDTAIPFPCACKCV